MKYIIFLTIFVLPFAVFAAPIVPCGDQNYTGAEADAYNSAHSAEIQAKTILPKSAGDIKNPCEFRHFIIGINNIINFLIMIGGSIAAIVFAIAGFMILTAGGNEAQVKTAKGMFMQVVWGFVWMLAAWLLVKMVLVGLGVPTDFSFLGS